MRDTELPAVPNYQELRDYRAVCDGHAPACERLAKLEAADMALVQSVLDAITNQDAPAFAKRLLGMVQVTGLWFADRECARQFSRTSRSPRIARCKAMTTGSGSSRSPSPRPARPTARRSS